MKAAVITLVVGLAGTVLGGLVTDWYGIGGSPNRAIAHVTAFNQYGNSVGQFPSATFSVDNQGRKTAENCLITWKTGMSVAGFAQQLSSAAFALQGGQSQTLTLKGPLSWGQPGSTTSEAWVTCSNSAASPKLVARVFVSGG